MEVRFRFESRQPAGTDRSSAPASTPDSDERTMGVGLTSSMSMDFGTAEKNQSARTCPLIVLELVNPIPIALLPKSRFLASGVGVV